MVKVIMAQSLAVKRGYVIDDKGRLRRKNVLDKYYEAGVLALIKSPFSAEQRKKAGEILARDYYLGHYNTLQSVKYYESNIKGTGDGGIEMSLYYKNKYLEAIRSIPHEFREMVYRVCVEDKKLVEEKEKTNKNLTDKNIVFYRKMLLVLGLERLLKFYLQKNKKSS